MDCQLDLRTIKLVLILALASVCVACVGFRASDSSRMENIHLSVSEEQQYWKNWITAYCGEDCPLQPFVYSHSQQVVDQADNLIRRLGSHENSALFARVNIDNGLLHLIYLAWDDSSDRVDLVEAKGLMDRPSSSARTKGETPITTPLANLANKGDFVDILNPKMLDADSLYLSVRRGSDVSRFAAYGHEIDADGSEHALVQFARYLLRRSASKPKP